ncbi:ATPase family gene 2 protein isoform X2 [Nasonia vitripennis]|uniref:Peroxisomal ATPase PEX1 n=1 Tax=Nasonia vitripennis TaxID=7425 RepID=A0A7M7H7F8_NASVI|nr:ATPase family gene 2 protein isoform X2 [Nasonia vitripennis]
MRWAEVSARCCIRDQIFRKRAVVMLRCAAVIDKILSKTAALWGKYKKAVILGRCNGSVEPNVVKLRHNDVNYYLSWYTRPSPDNSMLCLSATFARTLNIKEGDEVFVSCAEEPPPLTSLLVAPRSSHDREILELQCENVQANLLNQISVVAKDQTIVAWVSKFLSVTLIVTQLNPQFKYGRLQENTEIHVGDAVAIPVPSETTAESEVQNSLSGILGDMFTASIHVKKTYRAQPLPRISSFESAFRVYVPRSQLPGLVSSDALGRIRKVREDRQHVKAGGMRFAKRTDGSKEFTVQVCPLEDLLARLPKTFDENYFTSFSRHPCVFVAEDLLDNLRIRVGGKVVLESIDEVQSSVVCKSIEISSCEKSASVEVFRDYVIRNSKDNKMLLNSHAQISVDDDTWYLVKLSPEDCSYGLFDVGVLRSMDVRVNKASVEDVRPVEEPTEDTDVPIKSVATEILQEIISECKGVLTLSLGLHNVGDFEYDRENLLISGTTGSGKTTVCKLLREILTASPYFVHARVVDCRSLKGKKSEVIQKLLATELSQAVYYQPSILFLDDLESITSAGSNTEENTPDSMNAARITDAIFNTITEYQATNYISVVATCTDVTKVGKKLREARGVHFFRTILTIPNLEKDDRIKILRKSLQDKLYLSKEIDWDHYANKTEGWVAQDLVVLADKAAFTAWKRHVKEKSQGSLMLRDDDLSSTLSRCTPMSLHGVNLFHGSGHNWSDIGGLASVKLGLVEILHWPLRYPEIFKRAPIKLQSGILLYGMPGTGKTMLAGAIAKECGLNLISVKGPELLSKYIGASEEAVRNVFEKAQRARPCVLFFDEFESLAPRRGHDSTGVTDRVVNQLLTHLDGIEGREGVAVVAASSRPDLLDPALLRPGRLDKSLLCPLPDEAEREEILAALCRTHEIDTQDLDLKAVASLTSGFTGADLNAVLMQARLNVIEEALENSSIEKQQNYADEKVTQRHVVESVRSTKPSLLASEKEKYRRIYAKFAKSESYASDELKHQRATLA